MFIVADLVSSNHTGKCIRRFGGIDAYCLEVVNIGVNTIEKNMPLELDNF